MITRRVIMRLKAAMTRLKAAATRLKPAATSLKASATWSSAGSESRRCYDTEILIFDRA